MSALFWLHLVGNMLYSDILCKIYLTIFQYLPIVTTVMVGSSPILHRAVVEHTVRQAVSLPFAQPMPVDAVNGALVDESFYDPFRQ